MSGESECDAASAPDDSGDENWEEEAEKEAEEDAQSEPEPEEEWGKTASTVRVDGEDRVVSLIQGDECGTCVQDKKEQLQHFFQSLDKLSKDERKASIMTALAILKEADTASLRDKYAYFLPLVGRVCRSTFCSSYSVSVATIARFRARIKGGDFSPKPHGGKSNLNAFRIDTTWLIEWFMSLAAKIGDVVPIRVRQQRTVDGRVTRYYSPNEYTLLPAHLTWERLHEEVLHYVDDRGLEVAVPAASTMRQLLSERCPTIRIRSVRSNICDECAIYQSRLRTTPTTDETEAFGIHTAAARRMRQEYRNDMDSLSDEHAVIIIDYSQNLTLPSVANTPSQWYFMSLWAVNVFGIYYANRSTQYNFVYGEDVAGKGSEEVISMLRYFLRKVAGLQDPKRLTIYTDNCTGQNKNNFVAKYLLALVHTATLERVDLKFFVKGHTKNAVDRGFGHVRKKFARTDVWTMDQLVRLVDEAATSSATVPINADSDERPGMVHCRVGPDDEPVEFDLRRVYDGIKVDGQRVELLFKEALTAMPPPKPNTEKIVQMHEKVRPNVPDEYRNDVLYAPPTESQVQEARMIKQVRTARRKSKNATKPTAAEADETAADQSGGTTLNAQPREAGPPTRKKARKQQ
ncbi:hypothetical protein PF002_g6951 [Phytophthora fragariae]|uniref:DUF7869 domain-containing protein n=2 Tax=Phytophthora fragariae TaxID=53985 RepID=A0A6A3ZXX3_9STRA|nr:hypothetical protein PF002_g6951 [Phytophthora fragariae]